MLKNEFLPFCLLVFIILVDQRLPEDHHMSTKKYHPVFLIALAACGMTLPGCGLEDSSKSLEPTAEQRAAHESVNINGAQRKEADSLDN